MWWWSTAETAAAAAATAAALYGLWYAAAEYPWVTAAAAAAEGLRWWNEDHGSFLGQGSLLIPVTRPRLAVKAPSTLFDIHTN
jgi:hypothetical protein